jgi:hypothetical protein
VAREIGAQAPPSRRATLLGAKTAVDRPFHSQTLSVANKNSEKVNSFWRRNSLNYLRLQNPYLSGAVNSFQRNRGGEKRKLVENAQSQGQKVNRYWPKKAQSLGLSPKALCVRESILWK